MASLPAQRQTEVPAGSSLGPKLRRGGPPLLLLLLALALFAPSVVGGKVLSSSDHRFSFPPFPPPQGQERPSNYQMSDQVWVFQPDQLEVREALRSGRLPTWTSKLSAGRPLLAAQQSAPLFPLNWIGDVLPYWESLAWMAALKLALAGFGVYLLCRKLGLGLSAALLGAVTYELATGLDPIPALTLS